MIVRQRKLFWQIFLANLAIILITVAVVAWYGSRSVDRFYLAELGHGLENRAHLIQAHVSDLLDSGSLERLRRFCVDSGRASRTRITVIDSNGTVLADTNEDPAVMDNHRSRPEIDTAFGGTPGRSLRFSDTLGKRMLYAAIPLYLANSQSREETGRATADAVLRLSMPLTAIDEALSDVNVQLFTGAIVAVVCVFFITFFVSRNISRPLEQMTRSAQKYAEGDFSQRLMTAGNSASREIATLGLAMDRMAQQLDETINTIVSQRNQLETVFSSMVEAVVAVDLRERIVSINEAAALMFGVAQAGAQGRLVQEVIRNGALHEQIERILKSGESFEDEIVLKTGEKTTYLQTNAVSLYGGDGRTVGALVVLNDVTRLRRLERVRSDFVANVSHELRTPITSIRGYVETLLDGALDNREDALKFLEIVLRQSEQLGEIVEDLLALSRIEKEAKEGSVASEYHALLPVLTSALETCRHKADEKRIALTLECPEDIELKMNRTLIEQAVVNLLVNGITYSEPNGEVAVRVATTRKDGRDAVRISVIDHGVGIAREHLPRLFERFYRSDRARNRKAGGTGLGLAIVKHIVQAHGGTVSVESTLGEGSEFTITLNRW